MYRNVAGMRDLRILIHLSIIAPTSTKLLVRFVIIGCFVNIAKWWIDRQIASPHCCNQSLTMVWCGPHGDSEALKSQSGILRRERAARLVPPRLAGPDSEAQNECLSMYHGLGGS